jgi:hypothetical protein
MKTSRTSVSRQRGSLRAGRILVVAAALFGVLFSASVIFKLGAAGATWYVDDDACPGTGTGSPGDPFCLIQDAICAASGGDTVSVAEGTYFESIRMRPHVDLISQAGPALTIIDATGEPCTETDYCTKRTGQCSAVLFGSGHSPGTLLDGFTITGGSGTIQSVNNWVAGGGIFVFSSPTISNNIITNNDISGPEDYFFGGGIFISLGEPVITGNLISGNRAVPGPGKTKSPTAGYGAGIYVGFSSSPTIISNTIQNNVAGDPDASNSVGSGGGLAIFPGDANSPSVLIDRNLISDNFSSTLGGGIHLLGLPGSESLPLITNNVFVGNESVNGGALYTGYTATLLTNNTITDNMAKLGGGIHSNTGVPGLPVNITNNIIEGNRLAGTGSNGGGIYTFSLDPNFMAEISFNDLFGNEKNQAAGEQTDATVIGFSGNFSDDPLFTDPNNRDFNVDANSPVIDVADAALAPATDYNDDPRGFDGDGTPDSPVVGDVDVGAYEFGAACGVQPELCDGLDNNCNSVVDEGFPDTDGDLEADCIDLDDDNDGVEDTSDCAPLDAGSFGVPVEVANVDMQSGPPSTLTYDLQAVGSGTVYEILSGLISRLAVTGDFSEGFCLAATSTGGTYVDSRIPPPGDGYYYMMRSSNGCGASTFGSALRDAPRLLTACSGGIVDGDSDGSPSDLDCNDADPGISPLAPELCDNLDNDCDSATDGFATACGAGECASTGVCTAGSDSCTAGTPETESCDGLDNDCDTVVDNGFPNTDNDPLADCVDPDDDNDGVEDGSDCAPLEQGSYGVPSEVVNLDIDNTTTTDLSWPLQDLGSETLYDLTSGQYSLTGSLNFGAGTCVASVYEGMTTDGRADPPPGSIYYYMVKSRNACGPGTYGTPPRDTSPACP